MDGGSIPPGSTIQRAGKKRLLRNRQADASDAQPRHGWVQGMAWPQANYWVRRM